MRYGRGIYASYMEALSNHQDFEPNQLIKLTGGDYFDERPEALLFMVNEYVKDKKIKKPLILTTSKEAKNTLMEMHLPYHQGLLIIEEGNVTLENGKYIPARTLKELIAEFLEEYFPNWKILDNTKVRSLMDAIAEQGATISYERMKTTAQQISAVSITRLEKMSSYEVIIRYGLTKKRAVHVKRLVGNNLYIPYSQMIEEVVKFPQIQEFMSEYDFIGVDSFEKLTTAEVQFLTHISKKQIIAISADRDVKHSQKRFAMNWSLINDNYAPEKVSEIDLDLLLLEEDRIMAIDDEVECENDEKLTSSEIFKDKMKSCLLNPQDVSGVTKAAFVVFNNPSKSNMEFMQILSLVPGFDLPFLEKFCDIALPENESIFEFANKYHDSLSSSTSAKLLPILNYLNQVQNKLDKESANAIMIHFLNFCKVIGFDAKASDSIKTQFIDLHMELKRLEKGMNASDCNNLLESYIDKYSDAVKEVNEPFVEQKPESAPPPPSSSDFKEEPLKKSAYDFLTPAKPMRAMLNFHLPVSITMNSSSHGRVGDKAEASIKVEDVPLRRNGSAKYKPRPRSWHAGNILNAARRLR
jgi:hypothetical protein